MSKKGFVQTPEGMYRVRGLIGPQEIVNVASQILYRDLSERESLTRPADAAQFLQVKLAGEKNELFGALFLDNKHRVLEFEVLFRGTVDGAAVYPRVVLQRCLELNAAAVILAHNHPSGHLEPSEADRTITKRLMDALALVDVRVLDHLVVSGAGFSSLAERGWV